MLIMLMMIMSLDTDIEPDCSKVLQPVAAVRQNVLGSRFPSLSSAGV